MPSRYDALPLAGISDAEVERALNDFVGRALRPSSGSVAVAYTAGTARLSGSVASAVQANAIEDLVRHHDGVERVVSAIAVLAPAVGAEGASRPG